MKRIPRWAWILAGFVSLILLIALILPAFLNVDRYRPMAAQAVEKALGRKVVIGRISARFLPTLAVVVDGFQITNPPGFPQGDVLSVEKIRGDLPWGALFGGEVRLTSLELVRPKLLLLTNDRGQDNYTFEPAPDAGRKPAATSDSFFKLSGIERLELADAEVATGNVVPGRRVAATLSAKGLNVTLSNISIAPLDVGKWQGEASLDGVIVALEGLQQPVEFRSGSLKLSAGKLTTDFRGRLGSALEFDGSLQAANVENAVPSFQLHTKELDLDALMAAFGEGTSTGAARPAAGRSELVAQGKLAADRLVSKPYQATDVSAHLRIYTDRTEVAPVQAQLYGGTLQISARADKTQVPQRFTANVQLRNLNMAALADASPDTRGKVSGTGELNLQLAGALGGDPLRTLTGSGNLAVRDGRLPGFNFGQAVKTAGTLAGFGNALSGDTPFSFMGGDLSIANQRTATQNLRLASPQGNVNLRGSLGFDRTLDFEGDVSLVASGSTSAQNVSDVVTGILGRVMKQNISRITVPISITGKFSDPKIRPSGAPRIETSKQDPTQTQTQGTQPQQQKKSILDLFRKP